MTSQSTTHILIVDDDESISKTLSVILQGEGYQTTTATTAKEAISKSETKFYNVALLDIKLPDMLGTQLLARLQEITPKTVKIMITGYPSLQNAVEAINFGAESYVMKPLDPSQLLKTIKEKLQTQQQAESITRNRLVEWVQLQTRKRHSSNFHKFLEETANELVDFGLTRNQAKTYITLTALGIASASEIASSSKIRREEVYRIIPQLEKHGVIVRKLENPRKFSAIQPERAIKLLIKNRLRNMKEEVDSLKQKQINLISKLNIVELPTQKKKGSIDVISREDNLFAKLTDLAQSAKQQIDAIVSLQNLKYGYLNNSENLKRILGKAIKVRIITEVLEPNAFTKEITDYSRPMNSRLEIEQLETIPFNLIIVDDSEALWGEFQFKDRSIQCFWTNEPTQIAILKTCFEALWQKSSSKNTHANIINELEDLELSYA
ncbi:MAG: response regulator [Candidatus Bathyarchaeota archaeon]|jgi:DNA-binding response OmpR family regulator